MSHTESMRGGEELGCCYVWFQLCFGKGHRVGLGWGGLARFWCWVALERQVGRGVMGVESGDGVEGCGGCLDVM